MRIGIFGGSFDPIHLGHLILAQQCLEHASLDQVIFIPAALSPHKQAGAHANDRQRVEMIEFAIAGHSSFSVSKTELQRGGVSYTVDTLTELNEKQPDDELFLLMGADSLAGFSTWKEPEKICQLATPIVVGRPGSAEVELSALQPFVDDKRMTEIQQYAFESRLIDISSTDLRSRTAAGKSVRYLLPRAVEKYIEAKGLYQPETETT